MKYFFTHETSSPEEKTLNVIRQIAHSLRAIKINGEYEVFCIS